MFFNPETQEIKTKNKHPNPFTFYVGWDPNFIKKSKFLQEVPHENFRQMDRQKEGIS